MRRLLLVIILLAPPAFAFEFNPRGQVPGFYEAEVTRVVDGDTFDAVVHVWPGQFNHVRVRLRRIQAWETSCGAAGSMATAYLRKLIGGKHVLLFLVSIDNFGRYLAEVAVDGKNVSDAILHAGHGIPYSRKAPDCPQNGRKK